ncbi:MAG: hemerythrin domain-containing protein [Rhodomicrobium sp.]
MALAGALGTGVLALRNGAVVPAFSAEKKGEEAGGEEVSATEDLMREHGVLRRTLDVYAELSRRLENHNGDIDPAALADTAELFHNFGEDYHERMLEEVYIFPELRKSGGANERLVDVLLRQHIRGREITDYLYRIGSRGNIGGDAQPLAKALASMSRMYNAHSAWEDTVVFPAWKAMNSKARLDELSDKFEDIEHKMFGKDGFEDAVQRVSRIEQALGMGNLDYFTAPAPPPA